MDSSQTEICQFWDACELMGFNDEHMKIQDWPQEANYLYFSQWSWCAKFGSLPSIISTPSFQELLSNWSSLATQKRVSKQDMLFGTHAYCEIWMSSKVSTVYFFQAVLIRLLRSISNFHALYSRWITYQKTSHGVMSSDNETSWKSFYHRTVLFSKHVLGKWTRALKGTRPFTR